MRIMSDEAPDCTSSLHGLPDSDPGHPPKHMRLASLFSGGKDSVYAAYAAQQMGHAVSCLVSIHPNSEESMLLHHPNMKWTQLQAMAMFGGNDSSTTRLISATAKSDDTQDELDLLRSLLCRAVSEYQIQGVVHGGIRSDYQRRLFADVCMSIGLHVVSPLWHRESAYSYMSHLIDCGFDTIITSVSAGGLDESWLGRHITFDALCDLHVLSERHGFALDFEGGEAETFVADCPMFARPIRVLAHRTVWDGYRGRFEILDAGMNCNA